LFSSELNEFDVKLRKVGGGRIFLSAFLCTFSSIYLPPAMISKTGRNCLLLFGFLQEKQSLKKWLGPFFCISFSRRFLALFIIRQTAWSETDFFFLSEKLVTEKFAGPCCTARKSDPFILGLDVQYCFSKPIPSKFLLYKSQKRMAHTVVKELIDIQFGRTEINCT